MACFLCLVIFSLVLHYGDNSFLDGPGRPIIIFAISIISVCFAVLVGLVLFILLTEKFYEIGEIY